MKIYKLLILLKVNDELHLVDELFGEKKYLKNLGKSRKKNNPDYLIYFMEYNLTDAKII